MSLFRRRVYEAVGEFDERLRTNEDYDYWIRAAMLGFRFFRNDRPLDRYRRRDDSLSASPIKMLTGILQVYRKLRPMLANRPAERAAIERQIARFEIECLLAETREAIETGNPRAAARPLGQLRRRRRGDPTTAIAYYLARSNGRAKGWLIFLLLAPLMVGIVVRTYGWIILLGESGSVNSFLIGIGFIERPIRLLFTDLAVIIGLIVAYAGYNYLQQPRPLGDRIDDTVGELKQGNLGNAVDEAGSATNGEKINTEIDHATSPAH